MWRGAESSVQTALLPCDASPHSFASHAPAACTRTGDGGRTGGGGGGRRGDCSTDTAARAAAAVDGRRRRREVGGDCSQLVTVV